MIAAGILANPTPFTKAICVKLSGIASVPLGGEDARRIAIQWARRLWRVLVAQLLEYLLKILLTVLRWPVARLFVTACGKAGRPE